MNALATAAYVVLIASFLFYVPKLVKPKDILLAPIVMLMLLIFSAALTGLLVFGKPVLWYVNGKKREAFVLLGYTLGIFLMITLVVLFLLFYLR